MKRILAFSLCLAVTAARLRAYVTSATLEYSASNRVLFYLNGVSLTGRTSDQNHWLDYAVLSSADGSLPLALLRNKEDNVLAADFWNTSHVVALSYRLTLYQSSGDPVVVWSEPGVSKLFRVAPGTNPPEGWFQPAFDDGAWTPGETAVPTLREEGVLTGTQDPDHPTIPTIKDRTPALPLVRLPNGKPDLNALRPPRTPLFFSPEYVPPELPDPRFKGRLGTPGVVPFITHNFNGWASPRTHDLVRSRFRIPHASGRVPVLWEAKDAKAGDLVKLKVNPGPQAAGLKDFRLGLVLPKGLKAENLPMDVEEEEGGRIYWTLSSPVQTRSLSAASVVEARGWNKPELALGPFKEHKDNPRGLGRLDVPEWEFLQGAQFQSGLKGWFRLEDPGALSEKEGAPAILGVIFHCQILPRGFDTEDSTAMDRVLFNYSVDGGTRGFFPEYRRVGTLVKDDYYTDAYYDATRDRDWTWEDVRNLRVSYGTEQKQERKLDNILASAEAVVSYVLPSRLERTLEARITERNCRKLAVGAFVEEDASGLSAKTVRTLVTNPGLCPSPAVQIVARPTPAATQTEAPTPSPIKERTRLTLSSPPSPTSTPGPSLATTPLGLSGLQSQPEPFGRGGVLLFFDLDQEADITLVVLHGSTVVRRMQAGHYLSGSNQLFYNGLDDRGKALAPGAYTWEIDASSNGQTENRNARFTRIESPPSTR
jgi:hypothetical protein